MNEEERNRQAIAIVERVIKDLEALEAVLCLMLSSSASSSSLPSSSLPSSMTTSDHAKPAWLTALYKQTDAGADAFEREL